MFIQHIEIIIEMLGDPGLAARNHLTCASFCNYLLQSEKNSDNRYRKPCPVRADAATREQRGLRAIKNLWSTPGWIPGTRGISLLEPQGRMAHSVRRVRQASRRPRFIRRNSAMAAARFRTAIAAIFPETSAPCTLKP
jgi:hypothetical protein